jgi:chromate reductase
MSNTAETRIAVIVGSLRKDSINRHVAHALADLAPKGTHFDFVEIGNLPLYNPDLEEGLEAPEAWTVFREKVKESDAVLFVTPEYNRSVPGALKNAIDVGSRPYGDSAWAGKPAAVVSVSPGSIGGFGANHHLRQSLVFLDMPVLQQPEAYIGNAGALLGEDGSVANEGTRAFLKTFMTAFVSWIATLAAKKQSAKAA